MAAFTIADKSYDGNRPLIMGVLNVTPDSFSDGGRFYDTDIAVEHALKMVEDGADIIDVGGESSRPGSDPVSEKEELKRVVPVIQALSDSIDIPVSIDTCKAEVAKEAIGAGARLVNDISSLGNDPGMADVIRESECSVVLMHMQGKPKTMQAAPFYTDPVEDVLTILKKRIAFAVNKGIDKARIIVDPGIGFGKSLEHNLTILKHINQFHETGCPVLIGVSRKSMFGMITGAGIDDRIWGTAAITAHCVMQGVEIHRVHDVFAMRQVCDISRAVYDGTVENAGG